MQDWTLLNGPKRTIVNDVLHEWEIKLEDKSLKEADFQRFLEDHAGLFFSSTGSHLVLAKPDMGGEYVPDLVVIHDNESLGFCYHFIELESPHDQIFTNKGTQAAALTEALQQVENWQRWLAKNHQTGAELFPSKAFKLTGNPQVQYSIIIGRREAVKQHEAIRLQKSSLYKCDIRTFDSLSDRLRKQIYANELFAECDRDVTDDEKNLLVSPFFKAMSSTQWRSLRTHNPFYSAHSMGWNAKAILLYRPTNTELLAKFIHA